MSCIRGVGGGGGGKVGGSSEPETKAALPFGQELTETATVGLRTTWQGPRWT